MSLPAKMLELTCRSQSLSCDCGVVDNSNLYFAVTSMQTEMLSKQAAGVNPWSFFGTTGAVRSRNMISGF